MATEAPLLLAYDGCDTCKKARRWLAAHGITARVRPIVDEPPTANELALWVPASGLPLRKWLNTSGQSYRAKGKEAFERATDAELRGWLTRDGKLVKRPILVLSGTASGPRVLVGFREDGYEAAFA